MSLTGLPLALTVPPINLLGLSFAGALIAQRYRRAGWAVLMFGLCGLLVLATPLAAGALILSLEHGLPLMPPADAAPEAIVILSADAARGAAPADVNPGMLTLERERTGAALARRTGLPILVAGGTIGAGPETLAGVMARSLVDDFNTPVRWTEANSADTWENAANAAAILQAEHIHSVYVVTHAWHMRRALIAFARTGITVTAAPVRLDWPAPLTWSDLEPRPAAWMGSYYALHEWIGCADYAWFR